MIATYLSFRFSKTCTRVMLTRSPRDVRRSDQTGVHSAKSGFGFATLPPTFSVEEPDPTFRWNRRSAIVPSDSRPLATVAAHPRGHAQPPFEPGDPIGLDRFRDRCGSRWRYTPREPSRAHGKRFRAFSRVWFATSSAHEHSRKPYLDYGRKTSFADGSVDPAERMSSPRSTSVRALLGLCTAPVRTNRSHTLFCPFGAHRRAQSLAWNHESPCPTSR